MEREIKIIVTGRANSGKTTIAELIQELLIKEGYNSEHIKFEELSEMYEKNKERRREVAKDLTAITIMERPETSGGLMA